MIRDSFIALAFAFACQREVKEDVGFISPPKDGTMITCPVSRERCEKTPLTRAAVFSMKTYYFCCDDCPKRFAVDPQRYVR